MKFLGASLVFLGCATAGFIFAAAQIKEECLLKKLSTVLEYMISELRYKQTQLPDLFINAAEQTSGLLREILLSVSHELDKQIFPNAQICIEITITKFPSLSPRITECLTELGSSLGRFDLTGQLTSLESILAMCRTSLESLSENKDVRLRTYRTLGMCFGAALVILFL